LYRERDENDRLRIPKASTLKSEITWAHVEKAFHKSIVSVDSEFLDKRPSGSRWTIRTALKNVIVSAVIIVIQHLEGVAYHTEKALQKHIYRLDILTPAPQFVGPVCRKSIKQNPKEKDAIDEPSTIEIFYSDGEEDEVVI
jgi:hypothetical protein